MKKNIPRIYIKENLSLNKILYLSKKHTHYLKKVLRMNIQDILELFNNTNYVFFAKIIEIKKENIKIKIFKNQYKNIESPLCIHLGQVISKNLKMDFTIQKSIEMGVNTITPLFSEYCDIQKKFTNICNKIKRWEKIIISACQQCNRNVLPKIKKPQNVFSWCKNQEENNIKIIFHPKSEFTINELPKYIKNVQIVIGSEGGFSDNEIKKIVEYGFFPIKLGPRILRTETAALVAITALQIKFGDLIT